MFNSVKKSYYFILSGLPTLIVGSLIFYLFDYKHAHWLMTVVIGFVMLGWGGILYGVFPDIFNRSKKNALIVSFKIVASFAYTGAVCLNINYVISLEKARENYILTYKPSIITSAKVVSIETRALKNGTRRYIHLYYIASGKPVYQEMPDDDTSFMLNENYKLKYAVEYPEMFEIYKKINPTALTLF